MNTHSVVLPLVGLALISTVSVAARAAGPDDEVDLTDGTVLHGRVTQQVPGSFVVIQTADGRVETLPWSEVKRVSASVAPATVTATAPAPAPAPASAPAPAPASGAASTTASATLAGDDVAPARAARDRDVEVHFELGARVGYSFASGDYASGLPIGSASADAVVPGTKGALPITLDLGMRMARYVYAGVFFDYGALQTSCVDAAPGATINCSGHDIRAGVDAQFHVVPRGAVDPWVGVGFGHEWLAVDVTGTGSGGSFDASQTLDGWSFADLMLGVDLRLARGLGFGPYLEFSSGSFGSDSETLSASGAGAQSRSSDITSTSSHQWFTLGVRGTFELMGEGARP